WTKQRVINGTGIDFVVFENPFQINSNPSTVFMEAIVVEVSIDGTNFCGFAPDYINSSETVYSNDPSKWIRYAGKTPVYYNDDNNQLKGSDIYDPAKSGGDGFDLSNLTTSSTTDTLWGTGCSASLVTNIQNNGFYYIRLSAASDRINPDTSSKFLRDSGAFDGPDIDGVFARYRLAR
ncbi:MAG: LIC_13355 family lipoprotein, partial [Leptospira sp.]|nr:LIC_13355 family lipoprotein [Leptospira sp.]